MKFLYHASAYIYSDNRRPRKNKQKHKLKIVMKGSKDDICFFYKVRWIDITDCVFEKIYVESKHVEPNKRFTNWSDTISTRLAS